MRCLAAAAWAAALALLAAPPGCTSERCEVVFAGWPSPAERSPCAGRCIDFESDTRHCGACGRACPPSTVCAHGRCACPEGHTACPVDGCVQTDRDPRHCGACGNVCPPSQTCVEGRCDCLEGQVFCPVEGCANVAFDPSNCGRCGVACRPTERCLDGRCGCRVGTYCPSSGCTSLSTDPANCGACGRACTAGSACSAGQCVCVASLCPSGCASLDDDPANCGACGRACPPGARCEASACRCAEGASACGGGCAYLQADPAHCGACGDRCARGERCAAGACGCLPGQSRCGDRCASLGDDPAHCGACGGACAAGEGCVDGRCAARAAPRLVAPPSGAVLGARRPTFRWLPARGDASARVELCRDRACATPLAALTAAANTATPGDDLPAGVLFWRVAGVRADGSPGATSATWSLRLHGPAAARGGLLGHTVDLDGDGLADLALRDPARPRVCVYLGGPRGLRFEGCRAFAGGDGVARDLGASLAFGDFDGDGFTDIAARDAGAGPGAVALLRGAPGGPTRAEPWWSPDARWDLPLPDDALHGLGDVDGDGYADLAALAPGAAPRGLAIYAGAPAARRWLPAHLLPASGGDPLALGGAAFNAGDLDGDGRGDLAVEPRGDGPRRALLVHLAEVDGPSGAPAARLVAASGERAALAGDFDGDGVGDLALAADGLLGIHRGAPGGPSPAPSARVVWAGVDAAWATSFDGARDLDGDGHADVVARSAGGAGERLRLHRGSARGLDDVRDGPLLGRDVRSIRWLGDVNGDGRDDVAVFVADALQVYLGAADGLPPSPSQTLPWPIAP